MRAPMPASAVLTNPGHRDPVFLSFHPHRDLTNMYQSIEFNVASLFVFAVFDMFLRIIWWYHLLYTTVCSMLCDDLKYFIIMAKDSWDQKGVANPIALA